jgi:uncharacterized protein (TIGR02145 family)
MKKLLLLITLFCALTTNAQNYLISFAGTGASNTVNSVKVENLTKATFLNLNGSDILRLTTVTSVNSFEDKQSSELKIYPNPMIDNSILEIYPPVAGNAIITVLDMAGKSVAQIQCYLGDSPQVFRLSGIKSGFYLINVKGSTYQYSGKLLCNGKVVGKGTIEKISISVVANEKTGKADYKGVLNTVDMAYTPGDRIKFTSISGNYSTVVTAILTKDETITFNFVSCADGDGNNYPVVNIGSQIWMAENLKSTKYRNGDLVGTTSPYNKVISGETDPKYQWAYSGTESNVAIYGRLYTWYAVTDIRNVCPTSWHVPSDGEWTIMENYLIDNGYNYDGTTIDNKIAKSLASTSGWTSSSTIGAVGNADYPAKGNATGFTALSGGYRSQNGTFASIGDFGNWWSTTEFDATYIWWRNLNYDFPIMYRPISVKKDGVSVRCIKDN